jgi:glycosyltransferase involved in cell wall biosynthesis
MRILYCIPRYDADAVGNLMHTEVIWRWNSTGHDTEVASLSSRQSHVETFDMDDVTVHHLPTAPARWVKLANRILGWVTGYPYLMGAWLSFRAHLATHRYDLIHIETSFPLGLVVLLSKPTATPAMVTLPGADVMAVPEFDYGYARNWFVRQAVRWVMQKATVVRADSRQIATLAVEKYGADPRQVVAIPYNITVPTYPPADQALPDFRAASRQTVAARHALDPAQVWVLSLNRLHPFKGIEYLIEALPQLHAWGIPAHAVIVGGNRSTKRFGDYGAYLQARAAALGVSDFVHLLGGVPHHEAATYMAACDVAVIPSVAESFSRVVIEATAVATPPVVTNTTGASDYVREDDTGEVVSPRDAASLAAGIRRAVERHADLQSRCPAFAAKFHANVIADELMALYEERIA